VISKVVGFETFVRASVRPDPLALVGFPFKPLRKKFVDDGV
jgi:hypothetical protein